MQSTLRLALGTVLTVARPVVSLAALVLTLLACVLLAWMSAPARAAGDYDKVFKGKAITDGVLTPGEVETVSVRKMPQRMKFGISVDPLAGSATCPGYPTGLCDGAFVPRRSAFVTSGRGRATVSFTMPNSYKRWDFTHPDAPPETLNFAPGEIVQLGAAGSVATKGKPKRLFRGIARTFATVGTTG